MPGVVVLTQETGGVSIFALQVICKAETLKSLGADHVISSKTDPNGGATPKRLTSRKEGVDNVIEVGGLNTLA